VLGVMALSGSAAHAADGELSTYWASNVENESEYIEQTTAPYSLNKSYSNSNAAGAISSGSGYTRLYDGKLGGEVYLNTEAAGGTTQYEAQMEVTLEEIITLQGAGSATVPVVFTMTTHGLFSVDTDYVYQFASLRSYFNVSNQTLSTFERADRYWEILGTSWDKYSDNDTAGAIVNDNGVGMNYNTEIKLTVMAKPGDKLLVYSALDSYLLGRRATTSIDFAETAAIQISLPAGYSFTSSTGTFLVPEPASLALFALGSVALLRRRRRTA
jgi:hypothetical protein